MQCELSGQLNKNAIKLRDGDLLQLRGRCMWGGNIIAICMQHIHIVSNSVSIFENLRSRYSQNHEEKPIFEVTYSLYCQSNALKSGLLLLMFMYSPACLLWGNFWDNSHCLISSARFNAELKEHLATLIDQSQENPPSHVLFFCLFLKKGKVRKIRHLVFHPHQCSAAS